MSDLTLEGLGTLSVVIRFDSSLLVSVDVQLRKGWV